MKWLKRTSENMKMKLIISFGFAIMVGSLNAQTTILTFEEAVKKALRNGVQLNQQRNNLELSQMQKLSSIASIGPNVSLNGFASQFNGNSFNQQAGEVIIGVRDNFQGTLSANMNLFSGFNRINSIKQFASALDAQSYFVNRTSQDVINTVSIQYLQVMLDAELLKIGQKNFETQDKQLQQIKELVSLGARSPVDEYNQDALTKAAELRLVQAEISLNNDKTLLTQTLLIDPFEQYDVESPNWDLTVIGNETLNIEELAEKAKQYRGDYLRAVKNEESSKYGARAAKGLMMPSLFAFGNYGSSYNYQHGVPDSISTTITRPIVVFDSSTPTGYAVGSSSTTVGEANPSVQRPFRDQFRNDNVFKQYGLQLTIPLFNGLQNRTTYIQQKVLYNNNQLVRKNMEYQIKNDVLRAVRTYEGAKKAFAISIDQLKAAEIAFGLETERYNLGVTNFVDYTNANRALVQAQTDKAQAEYRFVFQKILLEYAVGTLKAEDISQK
jgi:outer membrane protein